MHTGLTIQDFPPFFFFLILHESEKYRGGCIRNFRYAIRMNYRRRVVWLIGEDRDGYLNRTELCEKRKKIKYGIKLIFDWFSIFFKWKILQAILVFLQRG